MGLKEEIEMKRFVCVFSFVAMVAGLLVSSPVYAKKTGEQRDPPPQGESGKERKHLPCETVCIGWDSKGECNKTEVRCP